MSSFGFGGASQNKGSNKSQGTFTGGFGGGATNKSPPASKKGSGMPSFGFGGASQNKGSNKSQ
eukprot:CAMPEP_0184856056 /NCGR_PEP_ID=MMETSP0580-20130426/1212_1 /TAXON_ID=1118495 /ORGANISM="Dactyliosolen fragilissimus" /LENGTH=62 /DNA_ID=CAMNT_0027350827 /DNA_START=33 /DNA_END=218 /DNA_ORIENTATION=-